MPRGACDPHSTRWLPDATHGDPKFSIAWIRFHGLYD
jgi:hypothetical protein